MPDELELGPEETIAEAQRLLDADRPFHAHEVLEAYWKACPEEERPLWRGLAQLAVGVTHLRRGNEKGSEALFGRACAALKAYTGPCHGLDVPEIVRGVEERGELRLR
jgi:predicted metal-dependent hydrolase